MPYRVRNWSDYNAGLKQRGNLTLWLNKDALEQWVMSTATGRRGVSQIYSDTAIATIATLKSLFHLAGRQAQGFVKSVFQPTFRRLTGYFQYVCQEAIAEVYI